VKPEEGTVKALLDSYRTLDLQGIEVRNMRD
jgi:hypothetical protein